MSDRPELENEITDEMIEAGIKAFCLCRGFDVTYDALEYLLSEVFLAMVKAPSLPQTSESFPHKIEPPRVWLLRQFL